MEIWLGAYHVGAGRLLGMYLHNHSFNFFDSSSTRKLSFYYTLWALVHANRPTSYQDMASFHHTLMFSRCAPSHPMVSMTTQSLSSNMDSTLFCGLQLPTEYWFEPFGSAVPDIWTILWTLLAWRGSVLKFLSIFLVIHLTLSMMALPKCHIFQLWFKCWVKLNIVTGRSEWGRVQGEECQGS